MNEEMCDRFVVYGYNRNTSRSTHIKAVFPFEDDAIAYAKTVFEPNSYIAVYDSGKMCEVFMMYDEDQT